MTDLIEVKTADLVGHALDWAVAKADGLQPRLEAPHYGSPWRVFVGTTFGNDKIYDPHRSWAISGPLIEKYKVMLTPPNDLVHRNFGPFDPRNGWCESGHWGSTIFGKERKHRRTAFHHPDSPLIAAMLAIAQFELGDTVQVPKELMP